MALLNDTNYEVSEGGEESFIVSGAHRVDINSNAEPQRATKMFGCEKCGASYTRKRTLLQHRCLQDGEQCFCCAVCGQAFGQQELLTRHYHIHLETFKCPVCGKCFNNRGSMTTHHRSHKQNPYVCDCCRQSFTFKKEFDCHGCANLESTPFNCDNCHKSFRRKQDVERHRCTQVNELAEEDLFVQCIIEEVILVPVLSESDTEVADATTQHTCQGSELRGMLSVQNRFDNKWNPVVRILRQPEIDMLAKTVI